MLAIHLSLAAVAVAAMAIRPRGNSSAVVLATLAIVDLALGAPGSSAITTVGPVVAFLTAAMTLAAITARSGLADRIGLMLARGARGQPAALYGLVCGACALLTATVSLDGAVVLMVPIVLSLHRQQDAPLAPLLLGVVGVANVVSISVPQGNPTNLVVIDHLHLSPLAFTSDMLVPGVTAALATATAIAILERRHLRGRYRCPPSGPGPSSPQQRSAALMLGAAALAGWSAPLIGIPPWWPFVGVVAVSLLATRAWSTLVVPWRIAIQVAGLVVVVEALGIRPPEPHAQTVAVLLLVAAGTGTAAALINNLPASVWAASLITAGPVALAAVTGLAIGALAAPQGSLATLIAADLAGPTAPDFSVKRLAPVAIAALLVAVLLLHASA